MSIVFWPLFTPNYTYSLLYHKIKHLLHIHHSHNIRKEESPQVLPRSQASQVSATRSLYFILLNFMRLVKQFLQFSIVYADVIYLIPLFYNGNGFSVSISTVGTGLRSLFRPYIHLLYFNYAVIKNIPIEKAAMSFYDHCCKKCTFPGGIEPSTSA